jgi:lipoprotein Spr
MTRRQYYVCIISIALSLVACKTSQTISNKESSKTSNSDTKSIKKKYAEVLHVSESEIKNTALYQFINHWYGVPYKYGGKDKKGIDCSGLTAMLYNQVYHMTITPSTKALINEVKKIKTSDLKEGDLVFFNIKSSTASHVGVYLQNQKFVHASSSKGVMISDLNETYFKKNFYSAGRVK